MPRGKKSPEKSGAVWGAKTRLADYRYIDGKRWERTSDPTGKYIAQGKADSARERGYNARVVKNGDRYVVYKKKAMSTKRKQYRKEYGKASKAGKVNSKRLSPRRK